jgi:hypothetical protein
MSDSTLTLLLSGNYGGQFSNANSTTVTLPSADAASARQFITNMFRNGQGCYDDLGVWYPISSILKVSIS